MLDRRARTAENVRKAIAKPAIFSAAGAGAPAVFGATCTGAPRRDARSIGSARLDKGVSALQNIHHAFVRVRVPPLRAPLRVPDARGPDAELSGVRQRGPGEATVGFCRQHNGLFARARRPARTLRDLRRPSRPRGLLDSLTASRCRFAPAASPRPLRPGRFAPAASPWLLRPDGSALTGSARPT